MTARRLCSRTKTLLINMSKLHLAAGSQQPPKVDGKLRLYSMEYCPYAQRPRLVLNAKNIPHDIVNINLLDKPDWYFKIHPEGIVPALDTGSEIVIESLVISDFLEEKYPKPALYPANPEAKKRDQELIEKIDPLLSVFFLCLWKKDLKTPEEWVEEFVPHLEVFESELGSRGTPFFGGSKPGMGNVITPTEKNNTPFFKCFRLITCCGHGVNAKILLLLLLVRNYPAKKINLHC
ncbi:pyrimidodiazepine synthase-like isoform X3 [Zophobas morio]|uniref:pyrimidodiazepine synthase-like isoform X3 n=1 Tax=Zophobas morio TaxID=2755281 RepID=UPI003083049E